MKKIIFLFFVFSFHSAFAFEPGVSMTPDFWYEEQLELTFFYESEINSKVGTYSKCFFNNRLGTIWYFSAKNSNPAFASKTSCFYLGWFRDSTITSVIPVSSGGIYTVISSRSYELPPSCPDPSVSSYYVMTFFRGSNLTRHPICESDCSIFQTQDCACPSFYYSGTFDKFYVCEMPPLSSLSVSEQTAKKRNDLLSESNSKLGSIAVSNSAITQLLKQIKDALLSLNSANFGIFGTNADSPNQSNKNDPNSPEFEPSLSNSSISVNDLEPMIYSSSFQCPADISIDLAGSSHHFSYKPFCDFSEKLRPLVIAAARVSAAWIVIGAL